MSVKYGNVNQNAGAVPVDTTIKTTSTTDGEVQHVNVDTSALPSGAATAAGQASLLAELQNKADTTDIQPVTLQDANGNNAHDAITGALMTIDYPHHEIHSGSAFFVKGFQDVDTTGIHFLFSVPNNTAWPHATWEIAAEGEFNLNLYEAVTTSTDGTAVAAFNHNRNSTDVAGVSAFSTPALASGSLGDGGQGGTKIWGGVIGSARNATETRNVSGEIVAKQNTKYWFEIVKVAAGTLWVDWDFNWYEHTNKVSS